MADAFLQLMVGKLDMLIQKEVGLIWGVDEEMDRISSLLSTIQAVLEDAEEKQPKDKALQNWLRKLKAAAYKVDDILDECATEAARSESYGQDSSLINKLSSLPPSIQGLTNLQNLNIWNCRELEKRCEKETGEDWYKIAHIPNVDIG